VLAWTRKNGGLRLANGPRILQDAYLTTPFAVCGIGLAFTRALATPVAAQDKPPRLAVAIAVGQARPLAPDFNPTQLPTSRPRSAVTWSATVQTRLTKHLAIEGIVSGWNRVQTFSGNVGGQNGTPIDHLDLSIQNSTYASMLNLLATTAIGRVRLSSGAGVGYAVVSSAFSSIFTQCTSPTGCDISSTGRGSVSAFGVQGVLSVDVRLTRRLQAFGAYSLTLPFSPGFGEISFVGGLKMVIR
jgi:hypothetical protein